MKPLLIVFLLGFQVACFGINLSINAIPDSLKNNANAVVRYDINEMEQTQAEEIVLTRSFAITILNEEGLYLARLQAYANDYINFSFLNGRILNAEGVPIGVINKKDIIISTLSFTNFKTDGKNYSYQCNYTHFPFTLECSYQLVLKSNFFESGINFIPDYHVSVQQTSYQYLFPKGNYFNFLEQNFDQHITKVVETNDKIKWELTNYNAISKEPYCPDISTFTPTIMASPKVFSLEGNVGRLDSWEEFGKFIHHLNQNRQSISPELSDKLKTIAPVTRSQKERAQLIYKYVQDNYRYVSIQLGIGRWQPTPSDEVEKYGFGDCKGLSNFTLALLNDAGIKSYYVLVGAGTSKELNKAFPSNVFNHVILMLPFANDTTWLECTNNMCPFGYLGDFTSDRNVLVISEKPYITQTPVYSYDNNTRNSTCIYYFGEDNSVDVTYNGTFKGLCFNELLNIIQSNKEQKEKFIDLNFSSKGLQVTKYGFTERSDILPQITLAVDMYSTTFLNSTEKRIFVPTDIYETKLEAVQNDAVRETPIQIANSWSQTDTVILKNLPKCTLEESITPQEISYSFGKMSYSIELDGTTIFFVRHVELFKGVYPKETFNDFYTFLAKANKLFNKTIALKKLVE